MGQVMQSVPMVIIILIMGFVLLVKGADFFVEGSSGVAKRLRVPSIIIGLTIVAMGTSLPETAVSVAAAIQGNNTMAVSNVTGSNIFNLMVVVGLCAVMAPVPVNEEMRKRDIPGSIAAAIILLAFGTAGMQVGRIDGCILLFLFAGYMVLMVHQVLKSRSDGIKQDTEAAGEEENKVMPVWKCVVCIIGGACAIAVGGDWVVDGASTIAVALGLSQTLIGLTIVSIGTSLPELVTSVVAARKNEVDMALGNAIGSNIFNILMVLGIAGAISPIGFILENIIDIAVLIVFSIIVWIMGWKGEGLERKEGLCMIALYAIYMVYICVR